MEQTVTTYLVDGDPKGTQYAFISNKIFQMFCGVADLCIDNSKYDH